MKIFIPTKGRCHSQLTLQNLPPALHEKVILVCPANEKTKLVNELIRLNSGAVAIEQPDSITTIAEKRKWIVETANDDNIKKIVMLDDDLRFAVRRGDDPGLFRAAKAEDTLEAFRQLEEVLSEDVPHAGFSARGSGIGDLAKQGGWQTSGKRMMYVLGYYLPIVTYWAEFGRVRTHEDIDITLQLLSMGFPNSVNFSFVVDQKFGNPGGCTDERSVESNNEDCSKLRELHPEYVSVEEKTYSASVSRMETRCAWQRALKDGIAFRTDWLKSQKL